jgi:hypothetical protein
MKLKEVKSKNKYLSAKEEIYNNHSKFVMELFLF